MPDPLRRAEFRHMLEQRDIADRYRARLAGELVANSGGAAVGTVDIERKTDS